MMYFENQKLRNWPYQSEQEKEDIQATVSFFEQLSIHFNIPFDYESQAENIGFIAGYLRECGKYDRQEIYECLKEVYEYILRKKYPQHRLVSSIEN